ncbi:hypothetical protein BATDEDRAFT_26491 [Batrachochytrium dendrobatidis JAM81]|uniref:Fungal lipase-type domain-containing protein n=1 Tax=Batrachochytrium dendrobatidis (strain JAM81 / FGSC 10211) TaxID=684364 RepID=F4P7N8_BATDJ|nr:uncharacterized protein BATDEDRAFT_26491 [Batrachochytrium dendrobatidis JAM81]EGF78456.1 hypothetical protein BATDEDRAFT_26491 [Batrachochytrium dendrobatidis JAM81]|eukprot:XP_006680681.1 hypothetical protein BATDEDRAFT_26491 [Batrachochytrium dendrobatidis JAM81]
MSTSLYLIVTACIAPVAHYEYFKKSSYKMLATLGFLYLLVIQCAQAQTRVVKVVAPSLVGLNVGSYQKSIKKVWKSHTGSDKKAGTLLSPSSATTSKMANTLIGYTTEEQDEMRRQYMYMVEKLSAELTIEFQSEQTYKGPSFKSLAKFKKYADRFKLKSKKVPEVVDGRPETSPEPLAKSLMAQYAQYNLFASAVSCKVVNVASKWECGPLCQDATAGTQIVSLIKDPTRSRTDMSVGYVGINNQLKTIIVSYRGTMGSVDWRQNLRAVTTLIQELYEYPKKHIFNEARVHAGFLGEFMRIRDTVARALLMAISLHPEYKIHITGHSKGGTLATLTAVDLYMTHDLPNIEKKVHLITFGTPRVGNREWAAWLDGIPFAEAIRVIHQNDPVVHLPPIAMGYQHTGVPVLVTADRHVVGCTYYKDRLSDENCLPHSPEKSSHTHNYFHKTFFESYHHITYENPNCHGLYVI